MPFNGSGTFSIVNTFVPNTTILSAAVNQNFTDIATGLSDCLTRDGQAGMTAVFKAISGSLGAPGISFTSDTTAGLFLSTTGKVALVAKSLGIGIDSSVLCVSAAAVQAGGSGYAVGDTITLAGGSSYSVAVLTVATLSGSAVATATVTYSGFYVAAPSNPVSQGSTSGSGTSATFNLTFTTQYTRSIVVDQGFLSLVWTRLGASSFVSGLMAKANAYDYLVSLATFSSGFSINKTTSPPTLTTTLNPTLVPGFINGLTLSTAGASTTMSIAAGVANDSTNTTLMNLTSAISKTTSSWAVGTGNGGLDTGAIAINTVYHWYEIERPDTGVVDVCFSTGATAPTTGGSIPAAYTLFRRIGSMRTNASSQWVTFTQTGDYFILSTHVADTFNATTSRTTHTLTSVPTGIVVQLLARLGTSAGGSSSFVIQSLQEADYAPSGTPPDGDLSQNAGGNTVLMNVQRFTNTSAQICSRATNVAVGFTLFGYGWIDTRGKS